MTNRSNRPRFPDLLAGHHWNDVALRANLRRRELQVLRLLCRGLSNQAIARRLAICYPTLRSHLRSLYAKLGCANRVEALLTVIHFRGRDFRPIIPGDD